MPKYIYRMFVTEQLRMFYRCIQCKTKINTEDQVMANRVLGIEIGENLTGVVEIDYKAKNPRENIYL